MEITYPLILIAYNIMFFWKYYQNPFLLAASELLEICWTHWIWLGKRINPYTKDNIYYKYPFAIPFLSTFYPWHYLSSIFSRALSSDNSFRLFSFGIMAHYILLSFLSFIMFKQWYSSEIAMLGAITLSYMGYSMRLIDSSSVYTLAWIPGMFIQGWIGALSFGMTLLAGYYPILIYIVPIAILNNPMCLFGIIIGIPQLSPFLWYYTKSVRWGQKIDHNFGKVKWSHLLDLIYPSTVRSSNGLLPFEYWMTIGIIPLMFVPFSTSRIWIFTLISLMGMLGIIKMPIRISARLIYAFCFSLIWMACNGLSNLHLSERQLLVILILQAFFVLINKDRFLMFPFTQWSKKPSEHIARYVRCSFKYPFRTGYFFEEQTSGYRGGFSLR